MCVRLSIREAPSSYSITKDIQASFKAGDIIILHNETHCMRIVHNCFSLCMSHLEDKSQKKAGDSVSPVIRVIYKNAYEDRLNISDNRVWNSKFVNQGIQECSCRIGKDMQEIWEECLNALRCHPYRD